MQQNAQNKTMKGWEQNTLEEILRKENKLGGEEEEEEEEKEKKKEEEEKEKKKKKKKKKKNKEKEKKKKKKNKGMKRNGCNLFPLNPQRFIQQNQHNIKHTTYGSHSGLQYLFEMCFSVVNILINTMKKIFPQCMQCGGL